MIPIAHSLLRHLTSAFFLAAATLLAACDYPAEFAAPLAPPDPNAAHDPRLYGGWSLVDGEPDEAVAGLLMIAPGEGGHLEAAGALAILNLSPGRSDGAGQIWLRWRAHASELDGETYYNARLIDFASRYTPHGGLPEDDADANLIAHPERGYWLVRATLTEDDRLALDVLWETDIALPGRDVDCGPACRFELFVAAPEDIAAAIHAAGGDSAFSRFVFARLAAPFPAQDWD